MQRAVAGVLGEPFRGDEAETATGFAVRPEVFFEHVELSQGDLGAAHQSICDSRGSWRARSTGPLACWYDTLAYSFVPTISRLGHVGVLLACRRPGEDPLPGMLEHQRYDVVH